MNSRQIVFQLIVLLLLGIGLGVLYTTRKVEIDRRQAEVDLLESRAGQVNEMIRDFERLKKQQEELLRRKEGLDALDRVPDPSFLFANTRWIDPGRIQVTSWEAEGEKQTIRGEALSHRDVARLVSGMKRTRLVNVTSREDPFPIVFRIEIDPPPRIEDRP
jgi:Tfp pilus assembly protein PilN